MKLHKPTFSLIIILAQLILSSISYYYYVEWGKANPELDGLISRNFLGYWFFLFILTIGFYEMLTKPSWFKKALRIFLICIILGMEFSKFIEIEELQFGIYNTAWFSAVVAFILILIQFGKYMIKKTTKRKSIRT